MSDRKVPAQIHNDFLLDLLETKEDHLGIIALALPEETFAGRELTVLPTVHADQEGRMCQKAHSLAMEAKPTYSLLEEKGRPSRK